MYSEQRLLHGSEVTLSLLPLQGGPGGCQSPIITPDSLGLHCQTTQLHDISMVSFCPHTKMDTDSAVLKMDEEIQLAKLVR